MNRTNGTFHEWVVGAFVLAVFALLVFFTIVISGMDVLKGTARQSYTIRFDSVGGLRMHDHVVVRGMPVGSVRKLVLRPDGVEVRVRVDETVRLRETYAIRIASSSLLGGNYLILEEGTGDLLPPDAELTGIAPSDWMRDLGETVSEIKRLIGDDELVGNLKRAAESLATVMARVERGEGTLGKLLGSDDTLYRDLADTATSIKAVAGRLDRGESSLGRLVSDDGAVYDSLKASLANIETVSGRLAQGKGTMGKLLSEDDALYADLAAAVGNIKEIAARLNAGEGTLGKLMSENGEVYDNIVSITENLKTVSERLASGEGTLGKLAADDKLYTEIQGLVGDIRQVIDNFRETAPLTTFGSMVIGGL